MKFPGNIANNIRCHGFKPVATRLALLLLPLCFIGAKAAESKGLAAAEADKPELVVQSGHSGIIVQIASASAGTFFSTSDLDGVILIHNSKGQFIREISGLESCKMEWIEEQLVCWNRSMAYRIDKHSSNIQVIKNSAPIIRFFSHGGKLTYVDSNGCISIVRQGDGAKNCINLEMWQKVIDAVVVKDDIYLLCKDTRMGVDSIFLIGFKDKSQKIFYTYPESQSDPNNLSFRKPHADRLATQASHLYPVHVLTKASLILGYDSGFLRSFDLKTGRKIWENKFCNLGSGSNRIEDVKNPLILRCRIDDAGKKAGTSEILYINPENGISKNAIWIDSDFVSHVNRLTPEIDIITGVSTIRMVRNQKLYREILPNRVSFNSAVGNTERIIMSSANGALYEFDPSHFKFQSLGEQSSSYLFSVSSRYANFITENCFGLFDFENRQTHCETGNLKDKSGRTHRDIQLFWSARNRHYVATRDKLQTYDLKFKNELHSLKLSQIGLAFSYRSGELAVFDDQKVSILDENLKILRSIELKGPEDILKFILSAENVVSMHFGRHSNPFVIWNQSGVVSQADKIFLVRKPYEKILISSNLPHAEHLVVIGDILFSFHTHGVCIGWNLKTRKKLLEIKFFSTATALITTPDGRFDYTDKRALEYVSYRVGEKFVDLQEVHDYYYTPGLLKMVLDDTLPANETGGLDNKLKKLPDIHILSPGPEEAQDKVMDRKLKFAFRVKDTGGGVAKAAVRVKGKLVWESPTGASLADMQEIDLTLDGGTNQVSVTAYNRAGGPHTETIDLKCADVDLKKQAKLFILSVGVNEYNQNPLTYSVADAKKVVENFEKQSKAFFKEVIPIALYDKDATLGRIQKEVKAIKDNAGPDDVVMLYFSGHGLSVKEESGKKLFGFIPQDYPWRGDEATTLRRFGLTHDYLATQVKGMKPTKVVIIMDACHSGDAQLAFAKSAENNDREILEKLANGTGVFMLTSSAGKQLSREDPKIGHGIFTYVLLEGLADKAADVDGDGVVSIKELSGYMTARFESRAQKIMGKNFVQTPVINSMGRSEASAAALDFPLARVR